MVSTLANRKSHFPFHRSFNSPPSHLLSTSVFVFRRLVISSLVASVFSVPQRGPFLQLSELISCCCWSFSVLLPSSPPHQLSVPITITTTITTTMNSFSQSLLVLAVVATSSLVLLSTAYPSGAPKCSSLIPKHAKNKEQTGTAPYKLTTSGVSKDKDGKSTVTVTLAGLNNAKFKGFIVFATAVDSNDKIGKFTKADKTTLVSCGSSVST